MEPTENATEWAPSSFFDLLEFLGDGIESLIPGDPGEFAILLHHRVEDAFGGIDIAGKALAPRAKDPSAKRMLGHGCYLGQLSILNTGIDATHLKAQHANRFIDLGFG